MFKFNINLSVINKTYNYGTGDSSSRRKKGIGFMEVLKNLCMKIYPYLIILKIIAFIATLFF
ncbi:hypothetical protein BHE86_18440 [Shigella sp. FC1655]|nr:hypothetical protein BGK50_18910 [Shigella sp. FC130]ODQ05751.1 hypothetical protein BGK50_18955 [Shigella sp. FC130]OEI92384.1 hypothetical protein BHE86_18440 [Shigella sp. FC1655]OEJ07714.1 hypothetical protein BHE89_15835 [Shigella sp. FC1967]